MSSGTAHGIAPTAQGTSCTDPQVRQTRWWWLSPVATSNVFTARSLPVVRHVACEMFIPASLIACEMRASTPGRSSVITLIDTGRFTSEARSSQATSTRRSGSISSTFSQAAVWTVTPRPRVMKPAMSSPGTGLQQRP